MPSHRAVWHLLHLVADTFAQLSQRQPVCECRCEAGASGGGSDCPALERLVREQLQQQSRGLESAVIAALESGGSTRLFLFGFFGVAVASGFVLGWVAGRLSVGRRRPTRAEAPVPALIEPTSSGSTSPVRVLGPATPGSLRRERGGA